MQDFNVVVTLRGRGGADYRKAVRLLRRLGSVAPSGFFNVLLMKAVDERTFLEDLRTCAAEDAELLSACLSRALPLARTFHFEALEDFESKTKAALSEIVPALLGKSFHVRIHRRGFKGRISSLTEERVFDEVLLTALEQAGAPGKIDFDDPDAIVALEIVGSRAGVSIWTREDRSRYPFLHLD